MEEEYEYECRFDIFVGGQSHIQGYSRWYNQLWLTNSKVESEIIEEIKTDVALRKGVDASHIEVPLYNIATGKSNITITKLAEIRAKFPSCRRQTKRMSYVRRDRLDEEIKNDTREWTC
tara:strand:+ start:227 stop:583 length:357 start_codon:yes stop_codon:yes gene_type:complete